jgi:hypothetical protein
MRILQQSCKGFFCNVEEQKYVLKKKSALEQINQGGVVFP